MLTDAPVSNSAKALMPSTVIVISQQAGWLAVPSLSSLTTSESDDRVQFAIWRGQTCFWVVTLGVANSVAGVRVSLYFCVVAGLGVWADSALSLICFSETHWWETSLLAGSPIGFMERPSSSLKALWWVPYHQLAFVRLKNNWMLGAGLVSSSMNLFLFVDSFRTGHSVYTFYSLVPMGSHWMLSSWLPIPRRNWSVIITSLA